MKKYFMILMLLMSVLGMGQERLELISYNIRMNTEGDGEHAWPHRRDDVVNLLRFHRADIFGVQEALPDQMDDLQTAFPDFAHEGVGRDDGIREGEFSAVFYRKERFKKLDGGTFWLSESPGQCSYGWDAACRRVCSWVKLEDRSTGKLLHVFNTHFDHKGEEARKQSALLILQKIREISKGSGAVVLCGDFNLKPESEPIALIKKEMKDSYEISELPPHASVVTYHGFTYDHEVSGRIDYVFVSGELHVERYGVLTDSRDRTFFSDHLPVLVSLIL